VIELCTGTKIWLAAGVTDMRRGFDGLSAKVQTRRRHVQPDRIGEPERPRPPGQSHER